MNLNEQEIERVLQTAPKPKAPADLRARLIGQAQSASARAAARAAVSGQMQSPGWLRRWWAVLVPAAACLACSIVLAVQQAEITELRSGVQTLSDWSAAAAAGAGASGGQSQGTAPVAGAAEAQQQELARLREKAAQLTSELQGLEHVRTENAKLRTAVSAATPITLSPPETEAMTKAQEKAKQVRCMNNLKQLDLGLIMWSADNGNVLPPNFAAMTNYIGGNLALLVCPSDPRHPALAGKGVRLDQGPEDSSYKFLAAAFTNFYPATVTFHCPFHGNVAFGDGHVELVPDILQHPEWLVNRNGQTYLQRPAPEPGQP